MGSCFSRKAASSETKPSGGSTVRLFRCREPPPGPDAPEVETVKEVLSETPARRQEEAAGAEKGDGGCSPVSGCDGRSEAPSDIGSLSESVSVSSTVTEKQRGERRPPPPRLVRTKRSVSGELVVKRDRGVDVGCGSGRYSPSPVRRREGSIGRTCSARELAAQAARPARAAPAGNGTRIEPGQRSGRRSVSPAVKRAADQRPGGGVQSRSISAPRVNGRASPRRRVPEDVGRRRIEGDASSGGRTDGNESLENPLVSLECFIFL